MKLIHFLFLLFAISFTQSSHHRKRHQQSNDINSNRRLKRRVKIHRQQHNYVPLQQLNAATTLGFQQGVEYAKRKLNQGAATEEQSQSLVHGLTPNINMDYEHILSSPAVKLGSTALLLGGIDRYSKNNQTQKLKDIAQQQFAMKDSVLSLVTKEIDNLGFVNQKIISLSRRTSDLKNEITSKLQNQILLAYEDLELKHKHRH